MLTLITEMVRNIVIIVLFAALVEMLLPEGDIARFVRLVTGLFVVIAVLSPLISLVSQGKTWEISAWNHPPQPVTSLLEAGEELQRESTRQAWEKHQQQLALQMASLARLVPGVEEAEVKLITPPQDGLPDLETVVITLSPRKREIQATAPATEKEKGDIDLKELQEETVRAVSGFFGIPPEKIQVKFKNLPR